MSSYEEIKKAADDRWQHLEGGPSPWIRIGAAMCGQSSGALEVIDALHADLDRLGITAHIDEVGCLGICYAEPLVDVLRPGTKSRLFFGNVTPEDVSEIVSSYIAGGRVGTVKALGYLGEEPIDGVPDLSELPGIKLQNRIALRNAGHIAPGDIYQYIANGGYAGIHKALTEMEPDDVIKAMSDSGLRGRGGAAFPTGVKWSFMVRSPGPPKYMLCNCEEGDPGAYNDKGILESDPHTLLEGLVIGGYATRATNGIVFIRHGHDGPIDRTEEAIRQAYEAGILGKDIFGAGFDFDIEVALTGESYVAGEETASDGGHRGKAFPAEIPTTVPRGIRSLGLSIHNQQRQDVFIRSSDHLARRRLVQLDRSQSEYRHGDHLSERQRRVPRPLRGADGPHTGRGHRRYRRRSSERQAAQAAPDRRAARWGSQRPEHVRAFGFR